MQTELDRIANQNHLQLIKALIPHLPASNRKRFSVLIKIMELQNVLRFYSRPHAGGCADNGFADGTSCGMSRDGSCVEAQECTSEPPDLLDVLSDVRCYCEGEEQQMIDQALQMMSMVELFSVMAQDAGGAGSEDCAPCSSQPGSEDCESGAPQPESEDCAEDRVPDGPPPEDGNCCI
ncbi:MAG: hypothetical protein LUG56_02095 [Lachnospiraceae bacterium]|nr:hypothetical protein [Lachnospiraceae bacterium]MCD7841239.1 hypothetical protein [Lachnospiraceae bacterium]